jgi:hypothetical protein
VRAIATLERVGTPEARAVLKRMAQGNPNALETRDAKSVLNRLSRQPATQAGSSIRSTSADGHSGAPAQEQPSRTQRSDRLREMVLLALRANDQKLGAVQLDIEDVLEDLTVTKREEKVFQPDNNTKVITVQEPRRVSLSRVRIFGDKLRYDYVDPPGRVTKAFSFDGTLWTELKELGPNTQVLIKRPDQMASMSPLDPRQLAVFDVRERLSEILLRSAFSERTAGPSGKTRLITAETKDARGFGRSVISFDPTFGLLPVDVISYYPDSTVARHTRIHYRKIEARDAWVLDQAVTHAYGRNGALPRQRWTSRVKDLKLLERHDDSLFEIDYPPKYLLHDLTKDGNKKPLMIGR